MKYGINLMIWTDTLDGGKIHLLDTVKEIGYDLVELPVFDKDVALYAKWGKLCDERGLLRTGACAFGPDENMIDPDPKVRRSGIEGNKKILDCCAAAGAQTMAGNSTSAIAVFSGSARTKDEWRWCLEGMTEVAEHAKKLDVRIAMEALNRFEAYFMTCMEDAVKFAKELDHPYCGLMYDTFHANIEEKDVKKAILSTKGYLNHVHISESDRSTPGTGQVHWDETFDALCELGYDGNMVVEAFGNSLPKLRAATKIWRKMYENERRLAEDALAFMKSQVEKRRV